MLPEPGLCPTEEPLPQTFSEAQRDEILDSWVTKGVDPLSLSMQCRLKFYSQCIGLESRMQTQPNYFKHLSQQRHFACSSFQQIELDVPRLKNWVSWGEREEHLPAIEHQMREMIKVCLHTYAKRNNIYPYMQSQGPICTQLAQIVYMGSQHANDTTETLFWLYTAF